MFIGIDLGGTTIKAGIVDTKGNILLQDSLPTSPSKGFEFVVSSIKKIIKNLVTNSSIPMEQLKSIGIGIPGLVDYSTGNVIYCTNLSWENVPLADKLKESFKVPIHVENDANVAALAESLFGSTKGVSNSVFMTLGTGIGGGIIIDNKLYSGSHGAGSEIGHMLVGDNFYNCNCGKNGCLETFASATAINKYGAYIIEKSHKHTIIKDMCNGDADQLSAKIVFDAAKSKDEIAIDIISRMTKYLSIGIVNIYNLIDPDIIAIGGGVSKAGDFLLDILKVEVNKRVFNSNVKYGDIVLAKLGNEAGIVGAAFLGLGR